MSYDMCLVTFSLVVSCSTTFREGNIRYCYGPRRERGRGVHGAKHTYYDRLSVASRLGKANPGKHRSYIAFQLDSFHMDE